LIGVGAPDEIPTNRAYRDYERRTTAFLDQALGLKETS
jgi:hypothetical protein